jgi:hypothetical protein
LKNHNQKLVALLETLAEMAEHDSLTGAYSGGGAHAATRFNAILNELVAAGSVPDGLFSPLPADAQFAAVGMEARLLRSYIGEEPSAHSDPPGLGSIVGLAPFVESSVLAEAVEDILQSGSRPSMAELVALAPFMEQADLSRLVSMISRKGRPEPPSAPNPAATDRTPARTLYGELQRIKDEMEHPGTSLERRSELMQELRDLTESHIPSQE